MRYPIAPRTRITLNFTGNGGGVEVAPRLSDGLFLGLASYYFTRRCDLPIFCDLLLNPFTRTCYQLFGRWIHVAFASPGLLESGLCPGNGIFLFSWRLAHRTVLEKGEPARGWVCHFLIHATVYEFS